MPTGRMSLAEGRPSGHRHRVKLPACGFGASLPLTLWLTVFSLGAQAASWTTSAGVNMTETYSDNVAAAAAGQERSEVVTDIAPTVRLNATGGRLSLNLDASFHGLRYANHTAASTTQTTLNSTGRAELVDRWIFLDTAASISRQVISPLGNQNTNLSSVNGNSTQVRNLRLSPSMSGVIASELYYTARIDTSTSQTSVSTVSGTRVRSLTSNLRWGSETRLVNFGLALASSSTYSAGQTATTQSMQTIVGYNPADVLHFSFFSGRERNNYSTGSQASRTAGVNMSWAPTERTQISAALERHPSGNVRNFSLTHRMPRSVWQSSYSQSIDTSATAGSLTNFSSDYQNLYLLCTSSGQSAQQCATAVPTVLQALGRPLYVQLPFLTNSAVKVKTFTTSIALTGVRNTVAINYNRSDSRTNSATLVDTDVFAQFSGIVQQSLALNWSLRLSPLTSATASITRGQTTAQSATGPSEVSNLTYFMLLTSQIGPKTTGSLNLRRTDNKVSSGAAIPYRENSLVGSVGYTY